MKLKKLTCERLKAVNVWVTSFIWCGQQIHYTFFPFPAADSPAFPHTIQHQELHSSHSSQKAKFPEFSLLFPCVISVFPVYFGNKITIFWTSKIKPATSCSKQFFLCMLSWFLLYSLRFLNFLCLNKNFWIPCVSLSGRITFHYFPCFPCGVGTLNYTFISQKSNMISILNAL